MNMTVGALARQVGVNLETVRFYEKQRLLPQPERTSGGHRIYSTDDVERLQFIMKAKRVGFTLKEIRTLMRVREADPSESCEDAMDLARHKVTEIDGKLSELHAMRDVLQTFLDTCPETDTAHCQVIHGLQSSDATTRSDD